MPRLIARSDREVNSRETKRAPSLKTTSSQILDELVAGRTVVDVPTDLAVLYHPSVQPYLISWFKYDPVREIAKKVALNCLTIHETRQLKKEQA